MTVLARYRMRMAMPGEDEERLGRLIVACWREAYPGILPESLLDGMDRVREAAKWKRSLETGIAWIAEQSGEPVGIGHMQGAEVTTLYVRKADQGEGLGAELLARMFEEIACLGRREAFLWALEENRKARAFYERLGGRLVARRQVGFRRHPN
ncbi:MAG: GNAT family N-acetyltransferase, partial [Parvibaculum sp.]|uniref:GNAT family N-acetyltransferase n=1 Tax=Parvibaculum sp. TaxID=2024848 RepID=UPI001B156FDC